LPPQPNYPLNIFLYFNKYNSRFIKLNKMVFQDTYFYYFKKNNKLLYFSHLDYIINE